MAEVYRTVGRDPIERTIARTREAQSGVKHHAIAVQTKAKIILASHRHDGHSTIELRRAGRLDWMVELNDDRGYGVAMTIEFGRQGGNLDKNGNVVSASEPVAPLRRAIGRAATKRGKGGKG